MNERLVLLARLKQGKDEIQRRQEALKSPYSDEGKANMVFNSPSQKVVKNIKKVILRNPSQQENLKYELPQNLLDYPDIKQIF